MKRKIIKVFLLGAILSSTYVLGSILQYKSALRNLNCLEREAGIDAAYERAELIAYEMCSGYSKVFGYGSRLAARKYLEKIR